MLDLTLDTTLLQVWVDDLFLTNDFNRYILMRLPELSLVDVSNSIVRLISLLASLLLLTADLIVIVLCTGWYLKVSSGVLCACKFYFAASLYILKSKFPVFLVL